MDPYNCAGSKIGDGFSGGQFDLYQAQFDAWVDEQFHAMDGPPWAYFEMPALDGGPAIRVVYETIAFKKEGAPTPAVIGVLMDLVWTQCFLPILEQRTIEQREDRMKIPLFWRKRPMVHFQDGFTVLRMRLSVPGYTILNTKPEFGALRLVS